MSASPPDTPAPPSRRVLAEIRTGAQRGDAVGGRALGEAAHAAEALHLEIVETPLTGARALVGHVLGMRLCIPAHGIHGPRETPSLLYLFGDALAIRPTDDEPLSAVPLYGLHIVMPHVALAHWAYKAGRIAHANLDLERDNEKVEQGLQAWTAEDFRAADAKVQVFGVDGVPGPLHVYQHLGMVHVDVPVSGVPPLRMKSSLPESAATFVRMLEVLSKVPWTHGVSTARPVGARSTESPDPAAGDASASPGDAAPAR
ncbi:MAG: hypothetical protein ACRDWE_02830 [Acidimicrobiales bacterium]